MPVTFCFPAPAVAPGLCDHVSTKNFYVGLSQMSCCWVVTGREEWEICWPGTPTGECCVWGFHQRCLGALSPPMLLLHWCIWLCGNGTCKCLCLSTVIYQERRGLVMQQLLFRSCTSDSGSRRETDGLLWEPEQHTWSEWKVHCEVSAQLMHCLWAYPVPIILNIFL